MSEKKQAGTATSKKSARTPGSLDGPISDETLDLADASLAVRRWVGNRAVSDAIRGELPAHVNRVLPSAESTICYWLCVPFLL